MSVIDPSPANPYAPVRPTLRRTSVEAIAFVRTRQPFSVDTALPRGKGQPVLVLPVIGRGDRHAAPARIALDALGYRAFGWELGRNLGPTPRLIAGVEHRLCTLYAEHGPVTIVGFSMGGVFARLLAHRHPEKIRQIATVCSPFRATLDSAFLPLRPIMGVWRTPDLLALAHKIAEPLPVPGTFIYSRNDGIVAWRSCMDPSQPDDCFEISGLHVTIIRNPEVWTILSHRLARTLTAG